MRSNFLLGALVLASPLVFANNVKSDKSNNHNPIEVKDKEISTFENIIL